MQDLASSPKPLELIEFALEKSVFEVRFDLAYLYWDRAGSIWKEATTKWPELRFAHVEPGKTAFALTNRYHFEIQLDKAFIISYKPNQTLKDVIEKAGDFIELITQRLELVSYSRVGLRLFYFKKYPDQEAASNALMETGVLRIPQSRHFGIDGMALLPEYAVRWEGKATGATVRIRAEGRITDFVPSPNDEDLKAYHKEEYGIAADIDYFTSASITVGQFRTADWVEQALHLVRRDIRSFLGGS